MGPLSKVNNKIIKAVEKILQDEYPDYYFNNTEIAVTEDTVFIDGWIKINLKFSKFWADPAYSKDQQDKQP